MKKKKLSVKIYLLIAIAAFLILAEIAAIFFPSTITPTERLDYAARDAAMRLRGTQPIDERIVIVAIDDFSFNWTGYSWPWPRTYLAEIVNYLNDAGAEVIGMDVFLFEEDPEGDQALADAFAETPISVTLVQKYTDHQKVKSIRLPQEVYRDVFDGQGITSIQLDDDAVARRLPVHDSHFGVDYFNWSFEVARLYQNLPPINEFSASNITLGTENIPLKNNRFLVNFRGPADTYPIYSAAQVALGDYPPENFKDKIVLIGATTLTLQDVYPTPFSSQTRTSGVEIVASTIDSLLNHNYLRVAPLWVSIFFILIAATLSFYITRTSRPGLAISLMLAGIFSYGLIIISLSADLGFICLLWHPKRCSFWASLCPLWKKRFHKKLKNGAFATFFRALFPPRWLSS